MRGKKAKLAKRIAVATTERALKRMEANGVPLPTLQMLNDGIRLAYKAIKRDMKAA